MLLALKFKDAVQIGHYLGSILAYHPLLHTLPVDSVVPIPLHAKRLAARGYNQSMEIARPVATHLGIALQPELLLRVRSTAPQSGYSLKERQENIFGAFSCSAEAKGRRILLVDDTFTTGSTVEAAARALKQAGAASLSVAVVSRTPRHSLKIRS